MPFNPQAYGPEIAALLALDGDGERLMPLAMGRCSTPEAVRRLASLAPRELFPAARAPEAALSGMYLYFSCLDEAHETAQNIESAEGSFWHGIMHRQEPDAGNAAYWFRRVGRHAIFPALAAAARDLAAKRPGAVVSFAPEWDSLAFIDLCERARREPDSVLELLACEVQRAEWQLLFDYCAGPAG